MKTKFLWFALTVSAATIAQANPGAYRGGGGRVHGGAVARAAPAAHAPARAGGFSSFHSRPTRAYGSRPLDSGQRYSSVGMRSSRSSAYRRPYIYSSRGSFTRSGPFTAATIRQGNRIAPFANHRNPTATRVWNQRNAGNQFRNGNNLRNGNNHLRADWRKHVFAQHSGDWHRDWDRHSDHWWNGHRCSFINGSWVIFNIGFDPWWPYWWDYPGYYAYSSPYYGYGYDDPYSYSYDSGYYDSGNYQSEMYYDQNSYPDQSQSSYDSSVYQTEAYYDPNSDSDSDRSQSNSSIVVAAQERLAREGYYHGESDGAVGPQMRQPLKQYQSTHGLRTTGYLDRDTLVAMGLR